MTTGILGTLHITRQRGHSGSANAEGVTSAIQQASAKTGVDFGYLVRQAKVESSLNPNAKAKNSSATGLFQFIEQTWLKMVKQHGAEHGYGNYADAIKQTGDGKYCVASKSMKSAILNLRRDPAASSIMAAELATDNNAYLQQTVGGDIGSTDLYMAHFLGAQGAANFLSSMRKNPWAPAASLFPEAAASNRAVFYENGKPLSLQQVYNRFDAKFEGSGDSSPVTQIAQAANSADTVILPAANNWSRLGDTTPFRSSDTRGQSGLLVFSSGDDTANDVGTTRERNDITAAAGRIGGGFLSSPAAVTMIAQAQNLPHYAHNDQNRYNS